MWILADTSEAANIHVILKGGGDSVFDSVDVKNH